MKKRVSCISPGFEWNSIRATAACALLLSSGSAMAQTDPPVRPSSGETSTKMLGWDPYLTFSGYLDGGYRRTQFFEHNHDATVLTWDVRAEFWLPPFRDTFSWGPYIRLAGIVASENQPWENSWQALPGVGLQVYPLSFEAIHDTAEAKLFGPLRLFGEYNRQDYWGSENSWRPDEQLRFGADYWRAVNVNSYANWWWFETWNGIWWQSADENTDEYRAWKLANSMRVGIRIPNSGYLSAITPYFSLGSSISDQSERYWENRLEIGGGIRIAPSLDKLPENMQWFNYLTAYAEYVHAAAYYRGSAPFTVPDHEIRVGITWGFGQWFK